MKKQRFRNGRVWIILFTFLPMLVYGQSMEKKTQHISVSRVIDLPAEKVWEALAVDYGNIANSHPTIISSDYVNGSLQGAMDVERMCYFKDNGSQFLHEKIVMWAPEKMTFSNRILDARKFPINTDNSLGTYTVESLGPNQSKVIINFDFRTKPAMMGPMAKGKFKRLLSDYLLALEHNAKTGEKVTGENFKSIKKKYKA